MELIIDHQIVALEKEIDIPMYSIDKGHGFVKQSSGMFPITYNTENI